MWPGWSLFPLLNTFFTWLPETKLTDFGGGFCFVFSLHHFGSSFSISELWVTQAQSLGLFSFLSPCTPKVIAPNLKTLNTNYIFMFTHFSPEICFSWSLFPVQLMATPSFQLQNFGVSLATSISRISQLVHQQIFFVLPTKSHYSYFNQLTLSHHHLSLGLMQLKSINWQVPHSNIPQLLPSPFAHSFDYFVLYLLPH